MGVIPVPSLSSAANFCPVEGSDYFDKPDGNVIKVSGEGVSCSK